MNLITKEVLNAVYYAVFLTTFGLYFSTCYSHFFRHKKHMKSISPKLITYIAFSCLLLIFATQAYLVYDYFETTKASINRETTTIINEAFQKELNIRSNSIKKNYNNNIDTIRPSELAIKENKEKVVSSYNFDNILSEKDDFIGIINLAINDYTSKSVPLNLAKLDSITGAILENRSIRSEYLINIVDLSNDSILESSKQNTFGSFLVIKSKNIHIDFKNKQALQLVLVNPFGVIIKRMSLMLGTSLILSIICLLAFRFLLRVLAQQKQLVAFKNEFLGNIAHELKRPVASLSFNLDCLTLPDYSEKGEQRDLMLRKAINSTSEMNDSIQMIVALTRVEEGLLKLDKQPIDLRLMFDELKSRFLNSSYKKVLIETNYGEGMLMVTGDKQLLGQCFANLLDNAIKYSGKEPRIKITVENTGNAVCVSITDNGHGIEAEKLSVIFDKYTRVGAESRKISGFGIGLNYVKTIVEKHRGEVSAISEPGVGSEFRVVLPL